MFHLPIHASQQFLSLLLMLKALFYMVLIAEELEEHPFSSNLLSIHNMDLGNSFKSLELDTDSSRGSRDSLDSLASSVIDDLSSDKVTIKSTRGVGLGWY